MDIDTANAGTGNETASQAAAPASASGAAAPAASAAQPAAQEQQLDAILPQVVQPAKGEAQQQKQGEADPLAAVLPQDPDAAAQEAPPEGEAAQEGEESITITPPEGFALDEDAMKGFMDAAKEGGLKQEQAQKLFDLHVAEQKKMAESFSKGLRDQAARVNAEWSKQCHGDPEFGGDNYNASCNHITAAIRRFIPDPGEQRAFVDFYRKANLQNAPQMFRFLARLGRETAEAGPAVSDAAAAASKPASIADGLYKGMNLK